MAVDGLPEYVAGYGLGQGSGGGQSDCGGIDIVQAVVDSLGGQCCAKFGEGLVVADIGVVPGEYAPSDAALLDPFGWDGAGGRWFVVALVAGDGC